MKRRESMLALFVDGAALRALMTACAIELADTRSKPTRDVKARAHWFKIVELPNGAVGNGDRA